MTRETTLPLATRSTPTSASLPWAVKLLGSRLPRQLQDDIAVGGGHDLVAAVGGQGSVPGRQPSEGRFVDGLGVGALTDLGELEQDLVYGDKGSQELIKYLTGGGEFEFA